MFATLRSSKSFSHTSLPFNDDSLRHFVIVVNVCMCVCVIIHDSLRDVILYTNSCIFSAKSVIIKITEYFCVESDLTKMNEQMNELHID